MKSKTAQEFYSETVDEMSNEQLNKILKKLKSLYKKSLYNLFFTESSVRHSAKDFHDKILDCKQNGYKNCSLTKLEYGHLIIEAKKLINRNS